MTVDSHDADWHGADVDEVSMVAWDMADMGKAPSSIAQVILRSRPPPGSLSRHPHALLHRHLMLTAHGRKPLPTSTPKLTRRSMMDPYMNYGVRGFDACPGCAECNRTVRSADALARRPPPPTLWTISQMLTGETIAKH